MAKANGVREYYLNIRERLRNYIKSDYLGNSETLLLYEDDLLGETSLDKGTQRKTTENELPSLTQCTA